MLKTCMVRAFQQGISVRQNGAQNEFQCPPKRRVGSSNLPGIAKIRPLTVKYSGQGLFLLLSFRFVCLDLQVFDEVTMVGYIKYFIINSKYIEFFMRNKEKYDFVHQRSV